MEKLSGPGPFEGIGLQSPVACKWNTSGPQKFFWFFETPIAMTQGSGDKSSKQGQLVGKESSRLLCIDFQYTSAPNNDRENVGLISVRALEGRVGFPLEHWPEHWWLAAFEPSVAAGAIRFLGDDFGEWRLTLSPEITIKPLKFIPAGKGQDPREQCEQEGGLARTDRDCVRRRADCAQDRQRGPSRHDAGAVRTWVAPEGRLDSGERFGALRPSLETETDTESSAKVTR